MRDYHVEAMNALLEYDPQPLDADHDRPTLTALVASAIARSVTEEREACARTLDDMVYDHGGGACQRCLGIENAARQIRGRAS